MTLRRLIVAGSFAAALLVAVSSVPATAQQDDRFYGRWEPHSTSTGGNTLYLDPVGSGGYLTYRRLDGGFVVQQYEVIRDFGDHVVIRVWWLAGELHAKLPPELAILDIRNEPTMISDEWQFFKFYDCSGPPATDFFFQDDNPENIWRRIQEWSARTDEGFFYDRCKISSAGEPYKDQWGQSSWARRRK